MLPTVLHQTHQALLPQLPPRLFACRARWHFRQGKYIFGQANGPGNGHQLVVAGWLAGIGFAAHGLDACENHPAGAEAGGWRVKGLRQGLYVCRQQLQNTPATNQVVFCFQKMPDGCEKVRLTLP